MVSLFKSFDCAQVAQLHAELHVEHSVLPEISAVTMAPFWLVTVPHQHLGFRSKRIEHDRTPEPRVNICVGPKFLAPSPNEAERCKNKAFAQTEAGRGTVVVIWNGRPTFLRLTVSLTLLLTVCWRMLKLFPPLPGSGWRYFVFKFLSRCCDLNLMVVRWKICDRCTLWNNR